MFSRRAAAGVEANRFRPTTVHTAIQATAASVIRGGSHSKAEKRSRNRSLRNLPVDHDVMTSASFLCRSAALAFQRAGLPDAQPSARYVLGFRFCAGYCGFG